MTDRLTIERALMGAPDAIRKVLGDQIREQQAELDRREATIKRLSAAVRDLIQHAPPPTFEEMQCLIDDDSIPLEDSDE